MKKALPHNFNLEKTVLSELMYESDIKEIKKYIFQSDDKYFFHQSTRNIFQKIRKVVFENMLPDPMTMLEQMPDDDLLLELIATTEMNANLKQHLHLLQELHINREVISSCYSTADKLFDTDINSSELIEKLTIDLKNLRTGSKLRNAVTTAGTIKEVVKSVKDAREKDQPIFVPFCFPAVDCKLKLLRKQMHVLSGTPGTGKTALALTCMLRQVLNGYKVAYFCGESSSNEIIIRLAILLCQLEFMDVVTGLKKNSEKEIKAYQSAMTKLNSFADNFYVFGKGDYEHSAADIDYLLSEITAKKALDAAYFDHLQNMRPAKHLAAKTKEVQVSYNVCEINNIIGNYNMAGTLLCQLNREAQNKSNPGLDNLKYASTIEEEAHVVTFLKGEDDKKSNSPTRSIRWYSEKTRVQGEIYSNLEFQKKNMEYLGYYSKF